MLRNFLQFIAAFIVISICFIGQNVIAEETAPVSQCMVYNDATRQYLYRAMNILHPWFGQAYTWAPYSGFFTNPYDTKFIYTEKDTKGLWMFIPVEGYQDTFYLKNSHYKEYLHTSRHHLPHTLLTDKIRFVFSDKIKPEFLETYMWRLVKTDNSDEQFTIINVKYNEGLITSGNLRLEAFVNPRLSRKLDVFTSIQPQSQIWTLKCKDNILPL